MRVKDAVGRFGEEVAARWLATHGLTVLDRNWRCPDGELDLVVRDGRAIAFVEVKTRSTSRFGDPSEAVTPDKAARIHRLAARWMIEHPGERAWEWRFDIVAVVLRDPETISVRHLTGAF